MHKTSDACTLSGCLPVDIQCVKVDVAHLADKRLAKGRAHRHISLQNVLNVSHNLSLTQDVRLGLRLVDDLPPSSVWGTHQPTLQFHITKRMTPRDTTCLLVSLIISLVVVGLEITVLEA